MDWNDTVCVRNGDTYTDTYVKKKTIHFKYFLKFSGDSKYERNQ